MHRLPTKMVDRGNGEVMIPQDALAYGLDQAPKRLSRLNRLRSALFFPDDLKEYEVNHVDAFTSPDILIDADADKNNIDWHRMIERSDEFLAAGRNHFAISLLSRVVNRVPRNLEAWNKMGCAYSRFRQYDDAIKCFTKAITIEPRCGETWCNRGIQHLKSKRYSDAASDFMQAVKYSPENGVAWQSLGIAKEKLNENGAAVDAFKMATRVQPFNETHWLLLAKSFKKNGMKKEASECLARVRALNPFRSPFGISIGLPRGSKGLSTTIPAVSAAEQMGVHDPTPNLGSVITSERHLFSNRPDPFQQRMQAMWEAIQNPVSWIAVLVVASLLYIVLGK